MSHESLHSGGVSPGRLTAAAAMPAFLLTFLFGGVATAQPWGPVVVARLLIDIEGIEAEFPDKARGWLPVALEINEASDLAKEVVEALRNPETSPVKMALDSVYSIVRESLVRELGFDILPLDTLRGSVHYLLGYPMGSAKKIAQSGRFAGALEIDVEVTVPDAMQSHWAIFSTGKVRAKGRPEMVLSVRYEEPGGSRWKEKVRVRSRSRISVDEFWVLGIRKRSNRPDDSLLTDLTREAAGVLAAKIRSRLHS